MSNNCVTPLLAAFAAAHEQAFAPRTPAPVVIDASSTQTTSPTTTNADATSQQTLLCELVELIGYLCEASEPMLTETLASGQFSVTLLRYILIDANSEVLLRLTTASATCLYTLIDENAHCVAQLLAAEPNAYALLSARFNHAHAAGVWVDEMTCVAGD
jgi:hypothetical protein